MAGSTLSRWSPFSEFGDLRLWIDRLIDEVGGTDGAWGPAMDVIRKADELELKVDLPGITMDEVKVQVEDGVLTVSGEHEETVDVDKDHYVRRERRYGSFYRSMPLPPGVEPGQISATCKDGVLHVVVPLPKPEKRTVTITPTVA